MRKRVLRAGASASTVGSSSKAAAANTESRGPISGMASSGGGPQRSGLLSLGAAAAAARGRGSADSSSATPRPRFAAHATPAPEDEGTILRAIWREWRAAARKRLLGASKATQERFFTHEEEEEGLLFFFFFFTHDKHETAT